MEIEIFEDLRKAITEYDSKLAADLAKKIVEEKLDLMRAADVVTKAARGIGDGYSSGELFLPDLVGAGEAMASAMKIIQEDLERTGGKRQDLGTVVIGTVWGDLHSIGKDMLAVLLTVEGFTVRDLGVDVKSEAFVEAVSRYNADVLCMSALLSTTAPQQKDVIQTLEEKGIRNKVVVLVGGGAISQEFAKRIGADGYDPTAPGGVKVARRLIGN